MKLGTQLALPVLMIVAAFGGLAAAQAKRPAKAAGAKKISVSFVEPKNNATVSSPVHMKFASKGIEISPVPPGDPKETRPGVAHYHVGIDQGCLAPGKTIVKGTPSWIHLGKGDSEMDMQLTPGRHRLSLQLGDDLHNTVKGLCSTITVNVQ